MYEHCIKVNWFLCKKKVKKICEFGVVKSNYLSQFYMGHPVLLVCLLYICIRTEAEKGHPEIFMKTFLIANLLKN